MESLCAVRLTILLCFICPANAICPDRCDCQHSQHLLCTNRGLRSVPKAGVHNPEEILIFSLGGNFIHNISAFDFVRFGQMIRLDLQYNQIQSIHPKAFEKLCRLEELYLGNNLITSVSTGTLLSLKKLRILYANSNEIKKLTAESFASLDSLIKLRLDSNAIEILQDALFKSLANLLYLHLETNKIRHIHRNAFAKLSKLRFLNLSGNKQTAIRSVFTFAQLTSLTTLLLCDNDIQQVGDHVFQNLHKLSKLALSNNKISQVGTEALKGLSGVRELLMDGNLLTDIPLGLLDPLEKIEELDFSNNLISKVDPLAFKELKYLKVLKLKNNQLTALSGNIFSSNNGLYSLDLNENNWTCDCRLGGFKQWMNLAHSQGKLLTVFVQCHHPHVLKGKYLDYLNSSQLHFSGNNSKVCLPSQLGSIESVTSGRVEEQQSVQEVNIQADQGGPGEPEKLSVEKSKRKKEASTHRTRSSTLGRKNASASAGRPERGKLLVTPANLNATAQAEVTKVNPPALTTSHPSEAKAEKFNLLKNVDFPVVVDPCEFNRFFILNITANQVTSTAATIHWTVLDHQGPMNSQVHFRVLFDRFGQPVRFHRFIYVRDQSNSVTLQELKEDTTYMVCIESVIADLVCQVASRDHCTGVVTLPEKQGSVDFQLLTVIMLGVNALLVFVVVSVWLSKSLRKKLNKRKSAVHVRQMYSTRRPLRSMGTGVSADFTGYQSNRPRNVMCAIDEADLIEFPCDRFLDGNVRREEVMQQRFSD
ncbi:TLR4 interactor with leucine rich repeats [Amia ocellicauda]|uniref:TLR4 interactor with leucine rich repeats n=1 Tax=Amia ocellicauda TaxID=2972642 RepID=UPI003464BB24|nr:TRIL protein [Amia calva]